MLMRKVHLVHGYNNIYYLLMPKPLKITNSKTQITYCKTNRDFTRADPGGSWDSDPPPFEQLFLPFSTFLWTYI